MTPVDESGPLCELCQEPGMVTTLTFKRGRPRRVCVVCLAQAIEDHTRWKIVKLVQQYIRSTISSRELAAANRAIYMGTVNGSLVDGE